MMLITFFVGFGLQECVPEGKTVNSEFCVSLLECYRSRF